MRQVSPGVVRLGDGRLATRNLAPGVRVYDEALLQVDGTEVRTWDPSRSKLAAALLKGLATFPVEPGARVLYLGAANGTTVSHLSDIVGPDGRVFAVEFSARPMRDLLQVAEDRPNLVPILADAWRPDRYARVVGAPDVVVQDIAQRDQAGFLVRNLHRFGPEDALLAIKARSVDVTRDPQEVYESTIRSVEDGGWRLEEAVRLDPHEKDHAVARFRRRPGPGGKG